MLFVISPAKALDYETPPQVAWSTQPQFVDQAQGLIDVLREQSPQDVARLMSLSDALAGLNVARYQAWQPTFTTPDAKPAVLAFDGDVYDGLAAKQMADADLHWLQAHLCILSGLYGVLRPMDMMRPYRLEMGTRLVTHAGKNLYQYWGSQLADHLNGRLHADGVLVNLASEEYFKSVDRRTLKARVVTPVFEERKGNAYKVVSFMAKRARGMMVNFATTQRVSDVEQLKAFDRDGYAFAPAASDADRWVFRRDGKPA